MSHRGARRSGAAPLAVSLAPARTPRWASATLRVSVVPALACTALVACSTSGLRGGDPFASPPGVPQLARIHPPTIPKVADGHVKVVLAGPVTDRQLVPVIVRNGLSKPVRTVVISGRSTANGKAVRGESQLVTPDQLVPDAITIGYVYFRTPPDAGAAITFGVRQGPQPPTEATTADLPVEGLRIDGDAVTGTIRNTTARQVGLLSVIGVCTGLDGMLRSARTEPPAVPALDPGATTTFRLTLGAGCVGAIVGAQGASGGLTNLPDAPPNSPDPTTAPLIGPVAP